MQSWKVEVEKVTVDMVDRELNQTHVPQIRYDAEKLHMPRKINTEE